MVLNFNMYKLVFHCVLQLSSSSSLSKRVFVGIPCNMDTWHAFELSVLIITLLPGDCENCN
jgi:hypothetical protein